MPKVYVTKEFEFEAAHHLLNYEGACARVHGHTYKLQVTASGEVYTSGLLQATDHMVIDFKELKKIVDNKIIHTHDHADLNEIYENPTAEVMVVKMFGVIQESLPKDVRLESVKLWETTTSFAEYRGGL